MNDFHLLEHDGQRRTARFLQTTLVAMVSLLSLFPSSGAAAEPDIYRLENRDASFHLHLEAALQASETVAHSLEATGVMDVGEDQAEINPEDPTIPRFSWPRADPRVYRSATPLDLQNTIPRLLPAKTHRGFSKSRWQVQWKLSLVESAAKDLQIF
ncbi:MAG: hypothetical protein V3W50_06785 [Thermoanaerobaculia bacterium]